MAGNPASVALLKRYNFYLIDFGWFVGLVYYKWFATPISSADALELLLLFTVGTIAASSLIGAMTATFAGVISRKVTGDFEGAPDYFSAILWAAPILGFLAAKYSLKFFG